MVPPRAPQLVGTLNIVISDEGIWPPFACNTKCAAGIAAYHVCLYLGSRLAMKEVDGHTSLESCWASHVAYHRGTRGPAVSSLRRYRRVGATLGSWVTCSLLAM